MNYFLILLLYILPTWPCPYEAGLVNEESLRVKEDPYKYSGQVHYGQRKSGSCHTVRENKGMSCCFQAFQRMRPDKLLSASH